MTRLAICIPTYNRSAMLAELLDSIMLQQRDDLEVIVSDDCSLDGTASLVAGYQGRLKNLTFIRQPVNIGLDRNFLAVVDAARSEYIWLMGDDDRLEPGGVQRVLDALDRWPAVAGLTLGVIDYDPQMQHPVGLRQTPETQLIEGADAVFGSIIDLLGFMSALVARRDWWKEIAADPETANFENYYVQVYIIGRVIQRFGPWGVVQAPCVGFRTGNDQFRAKFGWLKRLAIDVEAYDQIAKALFPHSRATRTAIARKVFAVHVMARIVIAKAGGGHTPQVLSAALYLIRHYWRLPQLWTRGLPLLLMPGALVRTLRRSYQRFSSHSGTARARNISSGNGDATRLHVVKES